MSKDCQNWQFFKLNTLSNSVQTSATLNVTYLYQNVRGLNTKTDSFYKSVCGSDQDIIAITESWIQDNISSCELFDDRYSVFRCDRDLGGMGVSRGGGVALAVKKQFKTTPIDLQVVCNNVTKIDIVGCKLSIRYLTLYVLVVYIPPNTSNDERLAFFEYIESIYYLYGNNIVILGDFNIPNLSSGGPKVDVLSNFAQLFALDQYNHVYNSNNAILDLVLSNISCRVNRELFPLVKEDSYHPSLNISLSLSDFCKKSTFPINLAQQKYNFRKANFPLLYDMILYIDWSDLYTSNDVNESCNQLYETLYGIIEVCVPKSIIRKRSFPVWFTSEIIKCTKRKHRLFKKLKKSNSLFYRTQYNELRAAIKVKIDVAYRNYIVKTENTIASDPATFWSFINTKKNSSSLPDVLIHGDSHYSDPNDIANAFASFFGSVYSAPSNRVYSKRKSTLASCITLNNLSEQVILRALERLKDRATCGPDNIPCFVVKDCAAALLKPLCFIFNLALRTSTFPDIWKQARITPVFKKGNMNGIANYRPVSILCAFAKVFEMSLYECIFSQVKGIISPKQHGFFDGRSTISNLACFAQFTGEAIDRRMQVDAVYNDFSKAFDRVDHSILLHKLDDMGFGTDLLLFLKSYLSNRRQYVEIRGHRSYSFEATSGAPQGSNLAPLIFLLFINDICCDISSNVLLFADDLKLFRVVENQSDCLTLQEDLKKVQTWCDKNNLPLNTEKCFVMTYTNKLNPVHFEYKLDNVAIGRSETFKDLGITFDTKFSFANHIEGICAKAMKMLGFIMRNSKYFNNSQTLKTLYFCYVRSVLEYGSIIWNPIYNKYIDQLESVQRKFVKFLAFKVNGHFPPRGVDQGELLGRFQIPFLINRRKYVSIQFLFKVCRCLIDCPELLSQIKFHVPFKSIRLSPTFHLPTPSTDVLIKTPLFQAMRLFNDNCNDIDACDLSSIQFTKLLRHRLL